MRRQPPLLLLALAGVLVIAVTWWFDDRGSTGETASALAGGDEVAVESRGTTTTTEPPYDGWSDPDAVGEPWPAATVEGLLTFRGNPTRTWYGAGPVPETDPDVLFRFPEEGDLCGESTDLGVTKIWCGTGWTGQPTIFERDGRTWSVFGAYDGAVHFIDADTGERILPDFPTGDLIKGTVTIDPDGYPLVYVGSRDNHYRILSIDGAEPVELWSMDADAFSPILWNDDWDSSGMVIDDHLFVGGENSRFFIVKLNRGEDEAGRATVDPEVVFDVAAWDEQLLADLGDDTVSVESSPMVLGNTVYFSSSGGLIQGYDISGLADGETPTRTFRFWTGDDTDATVVGDADGMLYVASEYERAGTAARSDEVGQLIKLDPSVPDGQSPIVWSVFDNAVRPGGMWATPAVVGDVVYAATHGGRLLAVDRDSGAELWSKEMPGPLWGSPVAVDGVLLIGDCAGTLHAFDVSDPSVDPPQLWAKELGGCIESTPAVWDGRIIVGTRAGPVWGLGMPSTSGG